MVNCNEILNWLSKIALDKLLHFVAGLFAAQLSCLIASIWLWPLFSPIIGVVVAFIIGMAKELWDLRHDGVASGKDLFATAVGGIVGSVIMLTVISILLWQR